LATTAPRFMATVRARNFDGFMYLSTASGERGRGQPAHRIVDVMH
jgi:hypothetical protein